MAFLLKITDYQLLMQIAALSLGSSSGLSLIIRRNDLFELFHSVVQNDHLAKEEEAYKLRSHKAQHH